jgi:hypothetical protein
MPKTQNPRALKARFTFGMENHSHDETRFQRWVSLEPDPGALPQATDEGRAFGAKEKLPGQGEATHIRRRILKPI